MASISEAANKEMVDAQIVIVAEDFRDLFGRSDQRSGVAVGTSELGDLCPEPLVDPRTLFSQRK